MSLCDWFRQRHARCDTEAETEPDPGLAAAQEERLTAERKLRETQNMGREVRRVASTSQKIRQENHFSARMREAWAVGRHDHG